MDLTNIRELKTLLVRYGLTPAKTYGQHFLVDRQMLQKIISVSFATSATFATPVIEIGPGIGTLTHELASRAKKVIAIERDPRFIPVLHETLAEFDNVEIISADALKVSFSKLLVRYALSTTDYALISNLPYEITTPLLWKIFHDEPRPPRSATLLVQAEVAEKIVARPPRMNLLALLVQSIGKPKIVARVPPSAFFPPPAVHSAIIEITATILPPLSVRGGREGLRKLLSIASRAFAAPRKKLKTTLGEASREYGDRRPAELGVEDWLELTGVRSDG